MPKDVYNNECTKRGNNSSGDISANLNTLEKTSQSGQLETIEENHRDYIDVIKVWHRGYTKR